MIFNRCLIAMPPFENDMVKLAGQIGRQPVCFALEVTKEVRIMICIKYDLAVDALAILIGDYSAERKIAANLIMRIVFSQTEINEMLEAGEATVSRRSDFRARKWRKKIIARGKCEECGKSEHLEAHHIIPWSQYPPGRIDVNNGECLCFDCHAKKHRYDTVYGLMKARGRQMHAKTD